MLMLLLFRTGVENGRGADREGRRVQDDRKLVATRFVVERLLIGDGQAEAAILLGKQIPANPPSYNFVCSSRARNHGASSPRSCSGGLIGSIDGMFSANHALARAANSPTDSVVSVGADAVSVMTRTPAAR